MHSGYSCNSGHYYCYVKAPNGTWYEMNDARVRKKFLIYAYICLHICCHSVYLYIRNYMNFFAIKDFSGKSLIGIFYDQQFKHSSELWF